MARAHRSHSGGARRSRVARAPPRCRVPADCDDRVTAPEPRAQTSLRAGPPTGGVRGAERQRLRLPKRSRDVVGHLRPGARRHCVANSLAVARGRSRGNLRAAHGPVPRLPWRALAHRRACGMGARGGRRGGDAADRGIGHGAEVAPFTGETRCNSPPGGLPRLGQHADGGRRDAVRAHGGVARGEGGGRRADPRPRRRPRRWAKSRRP